MTNKNKLDPNEIKKIYLLPSDFFNADGIKNRIKNEFTALYYKIGKVQREDFRDEINMFYLLCLNTVDDEDLRLDIHIWMFEILSNYAMKYKSKKTYQNVINKIESLKSKSSLFSKRPILSKLLYADSLFSLYNLKKNEEYEKINNELLYKSKYFLFELYKQNLEGSLVLNEKQLGSCLDLLAGCLAQLSRYFEPNFYLSQSKKLLLDSPNANYITALNLTALMDNTCLDYNGFLILEIIDNCMKVSKNNRSIALQKDHALKIERRGRSLLRKYDKKIGELRKHKIQNLKEFSNLNDYKKFCIENHLYLNEHSFFCSCNYSTTDNLQIETNHAHTFVDWTKPFVKDIDILVSDFINARHNYYRSLDYTKLEGYHSGAIRRKDSKVNLKIALLKNSFKICYSILDQIAYGIIKVFGINYESILKKKGTSPKLYFLSMWDKGLFTNDHFNNNPFLLSLLSIAKDLDRTEFSAFADFRDIRNAMEHRNITVISDEKFDVCCESNCHKKSELTEKTKLLLILTKSAIYSFNNLIRRRSKLF